MKSELFPLSFKDQGKGKPLVLLHAFPLTSAMWTPQVEAFSELYRIITPDMRGFGASDRFVGTPSVDAAADDIAALLDHLGINEPIVLGGLSMGGYVALAFARRHPQRLAGLVLADTRAEPDDDTAKANREKQIELVRTQGPAALIDSMMSKLTSTITRTWNPGLIQRIFEMATAQTPEAIVDALILLRDRPDSRPGLPQIAVPSLVVVGAEDVITPLEVATALRFAIPKAHLRVIPGGGHLSNMEASFPFNLALGEYLNGIRF